MPVVQALPRFLVKARPGLRSKPLRLGAARIQLTPEPLFTSIGRDDALAAGPAATEWYVVSTPLGAVEENAWDVCHRLMTEDLGVSGGPGIEFAEPDLQQKWITGEPNQEALAAAAACERTDPQDPRFPSHPGEPLWFQDDAFAQFAKARPAAKEAAATGRVRIAHLDTGYDPKHRALPPHINKTLERNFVEGGPPNDATDTTEGLLTNLGHGTGTMSILAGQIKSGPTIGGAPVAEIVPIRVANRVVLFSNVAIAQALDYVHDLCRNPATRVDVVTMSMGGLASQAWADAINALYEAGVFVVTAAGNNFGNLPTRNIVYPARFNRVVAACGVMANHTPYADLGLERMAGNYGPEAKMDTAMSAFTPNVPWARLGCPEIVDLDGAGTSAATPQIAAAAALWIQRHRKAVSEYPQPWMRVEAARTALFGSAVLPPGQTKTRLGKGELKANDALSRKPAVSSTLTKQPVDQATFPLFTVLTGLGLEGEIPDNRQRMLELEALQLSQSREVEALLEEIGRPPTAFTQTDVRKIADALASRPGASQALRDALGVSGRRAIATKAPPIDISTAVRKLHVSHAIEPPRPAPVSRRLRVFAYDPSLELRLETIDINEGTLSVRWEKDLEPGPVGEYIEVIDVDPASRCYYAPIDLNHPHLLVQDGLRPSQANPQFHQQMVYAVAMKTIQHFEEALGRAALWAPRRLYDGPKFVREDYVQRLRIYPHALRAENAYYSPNQVALLLGYFVASSESGGDVLPGSVVFTAVSHDIVAHETTHALLDGLHRRYKEATNVDVLAFHEAFADIVAVFQHFTMPESLRSQIVKTRGDLKQRSLLGELAVQFGHATGRYGALRDAIGEFNDQGDWKAKEPQGDEYQKATEAHDRGAVLVAAIFDAFHQIYRVRADELIRLATNGTGILPAGELPAHLVDRLAREASKVARQVLNICIRALDYCPPIDITFGEYLRALITADRDLVPDDKLAYRVAFISAFRDRGIYPTDVRHLSVGSLAWEPPPLPLRNIAGIIDAMSLSWNLTTDRLAAFGTSRENARKFRNWLMDVKQVSDEEIDALGLLRNPATVTEVGGKAGTMGGIEVHSVRPARRIGPDGQSRADLVIEITQTFHLDPRGSGKLRGGCTLLVDLEEKKVRYFVRKRVASEQRLETQLKMAAAGSDLLRAAYFAEDELEPEPFALLHRGEH